MAFRNFKSPSSPHKIIVPPQGVPCVGPNRAARQKGNPMIVDPSKFNLALKIHNSQTVELALFEALLAYAEGMPVIITVNDDEYLMHGKETCELIAAGENAIEAKVIRLVGDANEIAQAFNAEDCDWPELLEAGRRNFMQGRHANESYITWLKHEITKRGGAASSAA